MAGHGNNDAAKLFPTCLATHFTGHTITSTHHLNSFFNNRLNKMDLLDYYSSDETSISSTNNEEEVPETRHETSPHETNWMEKYRHLKAFHEAYGHCNVPNSDEDEQLLSWIADQRSSHRAGTLRSDHEEFLNELGFVWSPSSTKPSTQKQAADLRWMKRYNRLVAFKGQNGHMKVTSREDKDLSQWIYSQRSLKHAGKLRKDREKLMNQLEFAWSAVNTGEKRTFHLLWMDRYNRLAAYKKKNGHINVTAHEDKDLTKWIYKQRSRKQAGTLRKDREQLLNQLESAWKASNVQDMPTTWMKMYRRLVAFHEEHGHLVVTAKYDKELYKWITVQRSSHELGKLSGKGEELLNKIGFAWAAESDIPSQSYNVDSMSTSEPIRKLDTRSARIDNRVGNANLQLLSDYTELHGHTDVPRRGKTKELGQWLLVQNSPIQRRKLAEDKATKLLDLLKVDAVVNTRSTNWPPSDEESTGSAESSESKISWTHESETSQVIQKFPIGTRIEKQFEAEEGKFASFGGAVVSFDHFEDDDGCRCWGYMIHYDDGDREHMLEADVAKLAIETKRKKRGRPRKDHSKEADIATLHDVGEVEPKRRGRPRKDDSKSTKRQKKKEPSKAESNTTTNEERKAKAVSVVVATAQSEKKETRARPEKKEAANQSSMRAETNDEESSNLQQRSKRKVTLDDFDHNSQVEHFVEGGAIIQIGNVSTENREVNSESLKNTSRIETETENQEKSFDEVNHEDGRLASVVYPVTSSAQAIGHKSSTVSYPHQKFPIGTPVVRMFFDLNDYEEVKPYSGKVTEYVYVAEEKLGLYFVQYDDGDTEFMEEWEVAKFSSSLGV